NIKFDDPYLLKTIRKVEKIDARIIQLLDDMAQTMRANNGCGLAAVQVGILRRVAVIDTGDGLIELINPEIIAEEGAQTAEEGCLSFPGEFHTTRRPAVVRVRALNRKDQWCFYKADGLKARAFCHEIDHMNGLLFRDAKTQ
ncbi:MAG: peptide deformylase, partial [Oscillospiraceae bacterium]|nr:peptide deformylase [Oscillospiraceae bacterium]